MTDENDTMFQDAVDALRDGDRARAKDLLTRLLQADQNNATYWVWMSGAVETAKERIYCLETALKLDPESSIAKRGLILLGARPPDENVQPFPLNRTRAWEDKLLLAHERPKQRGLRVALSSPMTRLAGVGLVGVLVCGLVVFGLMNPRTARFIAGNTNTPGPSPTFTPTPTFLNATGPAAPTNSGPTPLAVLLGVYYTPTPLFVDTPRSPLTMDIYNVAQAAYQNGDWDKFISSMNQISTAEPGSADIPYYLGEAYRFKGDCRTALQYYNNSLKLDTQFAPGYLGLARARICIDPGADTTQLYDLALQLNPNFGEAYLDRANFNLVRKDFNAALPDLEKADKLLPDSALVPLAFAQAYLLQGDDVKALAAAEKANSIDLTLLPSYYYLGTAYVANGQYAEAIKPLQTYLLYETRDGGAYAQLGEAYTKTGDYQAAIGALNKAVQFDPNQVQSYLYLGISNLSLDNLDAAATNYKKALQFFPNSFDANIGLTEVFYKNGTYGNAYLQAETSKSKATTDAQIALAIYWRALSQEGRQSFGNAINDWKTLLSMPESDMTPQMRQDAQDHLKKLVVPTNTPKGGGPTGTPTPSPTNRPGSTATPPALTGTPAKAPAASATPTK